MSAEVRLNITYEQDGHALSLPNTISALIAARDLVAMGMREYKVPVDRVNERVELEPGSFDIALVLQAIPESATGLIIMGPEEWTKALRNVRLFVLEAGKWAKLVQGKVIGELQVRLEDDEAVVETEGKTSRFRKRNLEVFASGRKADKLLDKLLNPVHEGEAFTLKLDAHEDGTVRLDGDAAERLHERVAPKPLVEAVPQGDTERVVEETLRLRSATFDPDLTWRVASDVAEFGAKVADQEFLDRVQRGEVTFRAGDELDVDMRVRSWTEHGSSKTRFERTITKVRGHRNVPPAGEHVDRIV